MENAQSYHITFILYATLYYMYVQGNGKFFRRFKLVEKNFDLF